MIASLLRSLSELLENALLLVVPENRSVFEIHELVYLDPNLRTSFLVSLHSLENSGSRKLSEKADCFCRFISILSLR